MHLFGDYFQWAFKNITPYTTQYTLACEELFKLMALFVQKVPSQPDLDLSESEVASDIGEHSDVASDNSSSERESEVRAFRQQTLQLYLSILDGRTSWNTLIQVGLIKHCVPDKI
jgi:ubiquitin carboxyl-terminal hydrolase 34